MEIFNVIDYGTFVLAQTSEGVDILDAEFKPFQPIQQEPIQGSPKEHGSPA